MAKLKFGDVIPMCPNLKKMYDENGGRRDGLKCIIFNKQSLNSNYRFVECFQDGSDRNISSREYTVTYNGKKMDDYFEESDIITNLVTNSSNGSIDKVCEKLDIVNPRDNYNKKLSFEELNDGELQLTNEELTNELVKCLMALSFYEKIFDELFSPKKVEEIVVKEAIRRTRKKPKDSILDEIQQEVLDTRDESGKFGYHKPGMRQIFTQGLVQRGINVTTSTPIANEEYQWIMTPDSPNVQESDEMKEYLSDIISKKITKDE